MSKHLTVVLTLGLLTASSCASGPAVTADDLKLKRVVIYRNGVAYFEREGRVQGERVRFKVRGDEVGDFLASFAVIEKGGSSVRAASFPLRHEEPAPPPEGAGSKAADAKRRMETVVMELDGREHELAVGYIAEAPVWRPSYRLVLGNGPAHLQLWGIVQNLSGEDWTNTRLTLVADAPLALTTQLERPVIPGRPVLTDDGGAIAVLPQAETTLAEEAPPPPPAEAPEMAPAKSMMAPRPAASPVARRPGLRGIRPSQGSKRGMRAMADAMEDEKAPELKIKESESLSKPAAAPSRARNLAALAAVAVSGGTTRYELPSPVTVPDNHATMLLLADKEVPGEATYLFAPDPGVSDSASHPFRVARFTNKTGGLLERGPLAFFGEGGFLGQGVIDPLPDGASATVPFGLERGLAVERSSEYVQEGARLFQVEAGNLVIERQVGPRTRYKLKSGVDQPHTLWLKHPRQNGAKLVKPPEGTEDNVGAGSALVPVEIAGHASKELVLDERQGSQQPEEWLDNLADDAVKEYLAGPDGKGEAATQLRSAWTLRNDWKRLADEAERLQTEQDDLRTSTEETRENLMAIAKNKSAGDLRRTLTARLSKASARLDEVTKRLIQVHMQVKELELRFRETVKLVRISARA
ncbi:MAG TPA: DUF4139 domain-containing protein [Polyangia bacterium]|jgi:hypothetical protein|nr:DUF4139 domain-containing protein [Polyangia bacterium]